MTSLHQAKPMPSTPAQEKEPPKRYMVIEAHQYFGDPSDLADLAVITIEPTFLPHVKNLAEYTARLMGQAFENDSIIKCSTFDFEGIGATVQWDNPEARTDGLWSLSTKMLPDGQVEQALAFESANGDCKTTGVDIKFFEHVFGQDDGGEANRQVLTFAREDSLDEFLDNIGKMASSRELRGNEMDSLKDPLNDAYNRVYHQIEFLDEQKLVEKELGLERNNVQAPA